MKKIRALIIDDEPLARQRIRRLLERVEYVRIVSEARNGKEAREYILKYEPDLLFLDIQMPDFNGFEVIKHELQPAPYIIFVTAYDEYSLKAFDVHAIDYLLKPFEDERFYLAVEHARDQIELRRMSQLHMTVQQLFTEAHTPEESGKEVIWLKIRGRKIPIRVDDIYYFEADGNYVRIHLEDRAYLYRETIANVEEMMPSDAFVRVHRSLLLHKLYIREVRYAGNNRFNIILKNGVELQSSRSYKEDVARL